MTEPWFRDGLNFACTRCGACCTGEPGYVWVNAEEVTQIAEFRGQTREVMSRKFVRQVGSALSLAERPNGDCVFYDREGKGCTIYPVRPRQCRTWPFWHSNLRSKATWKETCKICPGAGSGEFIPHEEIVHRAAAIQV